VDEFWSTASPAQLDDLRARIAATRWPDVPEDAGWSLGVDVDALRDLCAYWADGFDWPAQEAALNALPRFRRDGIHFVHARSAHGGLPIVLGHGWPDSFWRYSAVVPLLISPEDPADAFDVVVPDMPGFGYSDRSPVDAVAVAGRYAELMTALGYERFGAAGGDMGSHVCRYLALDFPERVVAVHRTDAGVPRHVPDDLTPEEREWQRAFAAWAAAEGAYGAMHSTKPQTAAVGLTDSPAGLAAWMVEKLHGWGDDLLTRDQILTNVTIYWLTGTIGSSMRMYAANAAIPAAQHARRVEVPSGFSLFGGDVLPPPRAWLERTTNLVRVTEPARGGHFAAIEQPEVYAQELRDFFRPYR
jgi:pimeloyl-ACP methyl ester carboxylesterase